MVTMKILIYFFLLYNAISLEGTLPQHLTDARILQENILPENNSYSHKDILVIWKGINGADKYICHADCSGLIDALLMHSYDYSLEDLQKWIGGKRRPLSKHFFDTITSQKGFKKISRPDECLPGDLIAIKFPPGQDDSGHIMLINEIPKLQAPQAPIIENSKQWTVTVIDSTTHGHGRSDSRFIGSGAFYPGIGKGTVRLYTDLNNNFIGYTWSTMPYSKFIAMGDRQFVVGRLSKDKALKRPNDINDLKR